MLRFTTNKGVFDVELNEAAAPKTCENFLQYVRSGFYNGTIFHRVIKGFMIQGGGFEPGLKQKTARDPIKNEAANGLKNDKYTIAMARTNDPHSATCQFFINVVDNSFLNHTAPTPSGWGYAVFGKVVSGFDVIHAIEDGSGSLKYEICSSECSCSIDDMHTHFYCERCHRTFCFKNIQIPLIHLPEGFTMQSINYMVKGICADCAAIPAAQE